MKNQFATSDQIYTMNAIIDAVEKTKTRLIDNRNLYVFENNTLLNRINTFKGLRHNNPVGSQKHNDKIFSSMVKNFFEREEMRRGIKK